MFNLKFIKNYFHLASKHNFFTLYGSNHKLSHVLNLNKTLWTTENYRFNKYYDESDDDKVSEAFSNINTNYKQQLRINRKEIQSLLKYAEKTEKNEENYMLLLQCCGQLIPDELPSTRINLAQEIWQLITQKVPLTVDHYNTLLQCYIENKKVLSHKEFLSQMICEPNAQTYNFLLECVCENGDLEQAVDIMNIMKQKEIPVNETVFSSLVLCHFKNKDLNSVRNILRTMEVIKITLSSITYTVLLRGYIINGEKELFQQTLEDVSKHNFSLKEIISILNDICESNQLDLLPRLKQFWTLHVSSSSNFQEKLNNLCIHLIYLKKPKIAYELFKCFVETESGSILDSNTYGSSLIYELIKSDTSCDIIIEIIDDLIKTKRNEYALFKATEAALTIPNINLSLNLLQALFDRNHKLRNHYFWPILVYEARNNGEKGIFRIFKKMLDFNMRIESETLEVYSLQYMLDINPYNIIQKLKQFNLTISDILTPLSVVLLRELKIRQVADLTTKYKIKIDANKIIKQLASTSILKNDIKNIISILQNLLVKNNSEDWPGQLIFYIYTRSGSNINYELIYNLLKEYQINNINISFPFFDKIDHLNKSSINNKFRDKIEKILNSLELNNNLDSTIVIPHPRNMNLEELECHLIELREKQMNTRGVLRKLIQLHSQNGNVNRVLDLKKEFELLGFTLSPGLLCNIFDTMIKTKNISEAKSIYDQIKFQHPKFKIDEYKIIDFATLLIENGNCDNAILVIDSESEHRHVLGGHALKRNCYNLLNTTALTKNDKLLNEIYNRLIKYKYCVPSTSILSPLIKIHIELDDKNIATDTYIHFCKTYKVSPLFYELLNYLIKEDDKNDYVKRIIEPTVQILGPSKTWTTYAAVLAEAGLDKHLRRILLEMAVSFDKDTLKQFCQKWIIQENVTPMINIIKAVKHIRNIDITIICTALIRYYGSINDRNAISKLWNYIEDSALVINVEATKSLVDTYLKNEKTESV